MKIEIIEPSSVKKRKKEGARILSQADINSAVTKLA